MRSFLAFLAWEGKRLEDVVKSPDWLLYPRTFTVYCYFGAKLRLSTITTYLAGVQHYLKMADANVTVWSAALHDQMRGHERDEEVYFPGRKRVKIPFTRFMIVQAWLLHLSLFADKLKALAVYAALCLGFIFLFRKSEFLTGANRQLKFAAGKVATLTAAHLQFHYGDRVYDASRGLEIPAECPEFMSMYLEHSKGDQFGKGAARFAPSEPSNPHCAVRVVHAYCRAVRLGPKDAVFAGPDICVSSTMLANIMKATATSLGLPAHLVSMHSLRIGGLVALTAAGIPDHLKQLAGRWATAESFTVYARATMQQYGQIMRALNDVSLVTARDVKLLYQHTFYPNGLPL
jgi:hypothetical protein